MNRHVNHRIDFSDIVDISRSGVRRAYVFMGLGVNASNLDELDSYDIENGTQFKILQENQFRAAIPQFKTEFKNWILLNTMRELVETFSRFLSSVYSNTSIVYSANQPEDVWEKYKKKVQSFEMMGVENQLKTLRKDFLILTQKEKYFKSINQFRNCVTHRGGHVEKRDLNKGRTFELLWWGIEMYAEDIEGNKMNLKHPIPDEGILIEKESRLKYRFTELTRIYQKGDIVSLSPNEVSEICFLILVATDEIMKTFSELIKSKIPMSKES